MLEGWFLIAAGLLVLSGGAKFRDPEPTRGALAAAGFPSGRGTVQLLAGAELAAGAAALAGGSPWGAVGIAALYLSFAGFVGVALTRRLPIQSCGCFGRADTPPTAVHLGVNLLSAAAAIAVAIGGGAGLPDVLSGQPAAGIPYLGFLAVGTFALALILSELPAVTAMVRNR